jgi:hypothetical protein
MNRREELMEIVCAQDRERNAIKAARLVDEICFIEEQLVEMKKLPWISVDPRNAYHQKQTPAARIYKELFQQYNNALKTLLHISGDIGGEQEAESPLRKWVRGRKELNE